jgi:hypothetical protein
MAEAGSDVDSPHLDDAVRVTRQVDPTSRAFSISVIVSATRCLLTYVALPFLAPLIGIGSGVGPVLGLIIGVVAIGANVMSIRRFWSGRHPWRWPVSVLNVTFIVLLAVFVAGDLASLVT